MSTNRQVVQSWSAGIPSHSAHLLTDGYNIHSYGLLIGVTRGSAYVKVGYNYRAPKHFVSMTTSAHVGLVEQYAHMEDPPERIR